MSDRTEALLALLMSNSVVYLALRPHNEVMTVVAAILSLILAVLLVISLALDYKNA